MIIRPILPIWALGIIVLVVLCLWTVAFWRRNKKTRRLIWWLRLAALAILAVVALRPSVPGVQTVGGTTTADIYFVVDNTISMRAEDYDGSKTRMEGVRSDIEAITTKFAGARFSLITYDNQAYRVLPLVSDASAILTEVEAMTPLYSFNSKGSRIDTPVSLLKDELAGNQAVTPTRSRSVFVFTDGEVTRQGQEDSYQQLRPYIDGGAVLGYGTESGGRMRSDVSYTPDDSSGPQYVTYTPANSFDTEVALSKIDENSLRTIADQLKVTYLHRVAPGGTDAMLEQIQADRIIDKGRDVDSYQDLYWIIAPFLTLYFAAEMVLTGAMAAQAQTSRRK